MKLTKILLSTLSGAILALTFACNNAANNNSAANTNINKSNTAVIVNSNQTALNNTAATPNSVTNSNAAVKPNKADGTPTPAKKADGDAVRGELETGKTDSVILYVGEESGDYAAYCFKNDSEAGRAILAACKNGERCEVAGTTTGDSQCKVPGLEANLSASFRIVKAESVKSLGRRK